MWWIYKKIFEVVNKSEVLVETIFGIGRLKIKKKNEWRMKGEKLNEMMDLKKNMLNDGKVNKGWMGERIDERTKGRMDE